MCVKFDTRLTGFNQSTSVVHDVLIISGDIHAKETLNEVDHGLISDQDS